MRDETRELLRKRILRLTTINDLQEVIRMANVRYKELQIRASNKYSVGDNVEFIGRVRGTKSARPVIGTVTSTRGTKFLKVMEESTGIMWRVSATLLKKVKVES